MFVPDIVVIDGNNFSLVSHFATSLSTANGKPTQAIYGFLARTSMLSLKYPNAKFYVTWDSGHEEGRKVILPDYKKRTFSEKMKEKFQLFFRQLPEIKRLSRILFKTFDCEAVLSDGSRIPVVEADDKIGFLRRVYKGQKMLIVSTDKDFLQLVDSETAVFTRNLVVQLSNFSEVTGFSSPERYFEGRLLVGDSSDNIKGIPGVGEKTARSLLSRCSLSDFLLGLVEPENFREKKILEHREVIKRNFVLMRLPPTVMGAELLPVKVVGFNFIEPNFDALSEFEEILERNEIVSFDAGQIISQLSNKKR